MSVPLGAVFSLNTLLFETNAYHLLELKLQISVSTITILCLLYTLNKKIQ